MGELKDKRRSPSQQRLAPYLVAIFAHVDKVQSIRPSSFARKKGSKSAARNDPKKRKSEDDVQAEDRSKGAVKTNLAKNLEAGSSSRGKESFDLGFLTKPPEF